MTNAHSAIDRILDANLNRAREALRVMEEHARFALDDASLAAAIKQARHDLAAAIPQRLSIRLPHRRNVDGDVGRSIGTATEYRRLSTQDVALAAAKRLGEALRTIEEYGKLVERELAERVEQLRYRGYELEMRLSRAGEAKGRFAGVRLYVIVTEALCHGSWLQTAESALEGGADALQLREKGLSDRELLVRARRLAALCREHDAVFIVNDRPDIAVLSRADGVHLGGDDLTVADARELLPHFGVVGVSTHTVEQARVAVEASPDYMAVGPIFPSSTKPRDQLAGPGCLAEVGRLSSIPLIAIGGIGVDNVASVLEVVQCGICVCRSVIAEADPRESSRRLADRISEIGVHLC